MPDCTRGPRRMEIPVKSTEVRNRFLQFYAGHGHRIVPSASLIPHNDPTLFFTNAGMVQFKDIFTGAEPAPSPRAASSQKCLRISGKHNDLDNVGQTPRHHTFFEMLGNFSFGDYFKADAIEMAWELYTGVLGMDPNRIWVSVYEDDDEAYDLWRSRIDFPAERLQRLDAKENFWSMGPTGPCGPCSELHYDFGPGVDPNDDRGPAGGGNRYVEFCNLVFMQFDQAADGTRTPLPRPSIDTGTGLERLCAILQGVYWNYDTDLFRPLMDRVASLSGQGYGTSDSVDMAMRVIADHARATAFLVSDGIMPSKDGRGYELRRVMRRAIRFGVKLDLDRPFLHEVTAEVGRQMQEVYPELVERAAFIEEVVRSEEERFRRTLTRGMKLLDNELERAGEGGTLPGDVAFTLADTHGFPVDLTQLIAAEQGVGVDLSGFQTALAEQRARGRAGWKGSGEQGVEGIWRRLAHEHGETDFSGYRTDDSRAVAIALVRKTDDGWEEVEILSQGESGVVLTDTTPFYAESGGQIGDIGSMEHVGAGLRVTNTTKSTTLVLHHVDVERGALRRGDGVTLEVDGTRRDSIRRNHTATHLLHAALQDVLGAHVTQKGSLVAPDRLRFDFSHHKPVTTDEIRALEGWVNNAVIDNTQVQTDLCDLEEAKAAGAMALFGEKYDEQVRVVSVGGISKELCGGTHCHQTGDIGLFRITTETSVAEGVRRLEARTGRGALAFVQSQADALQAAAQSLRTAPPGVPEAVARLLKERRSLQKELEAAQREIAKHAAGAMLDAVKTVNDVKVLVASFDGDLREQADRLRDQLGTSIVVLAATNGPRVRLLAAATKDIAGKRVHAGNIIKAIAPLVGGGGGGRPDMAQAGGKDPSGVEAAFARAHELIAEALA